MVESSNSKSNEDSSEKVFTITRLDPIEQPPTTNVRIRLSDIRSNKQFLRIAAILFGLFVLSEIVGALASNSLSLLGDAVAMSIDVATYLANMYTENLKKKYGELSFVWRWALDVYIPIFAVSSLLAVSFWIFSDAIQILLYPPENSTVDIAFLYGYASANMVIDIICNYYFFSRGMGAFYDAYEKVERINDSSNSETENGVAILDRHACESFGTDDQSQSNLDSSSECKHFPKTPESNVIVNHGTAADDGPSINISSDVRIALSTDHASTELQRNGATETDNPKLYNLNMWSAFTHMSGDTLRTISVLLAALTATYSGVSGDICDAWASVVCTISILSIALPLIWQIITAGKSLHREQQQHSTTTISQEIIGITIGT